ncbi:MAG: hypothetical protein KIT44_06540 [Opitutaceae bacterium]|nr:hypothetical protein [Opitutaceae bacterium]
MTTHHEPEGEVFLVAICLPADAALSRRFRWRMFRRGDRPDDIQSIGYGNEPDISWLRGVELRSGIWDVTLGDQLLTEPERTAAARYGWKIKPIPAWILERLLA